jgi:DNA-binding transcriptional MerR regulator
MLTIGQLAAYAGVTVRAVRHYHRVGLLPEPERDASGYRRYGATAVVTLIRIRTLAQAGVPLSEVARMLRAGPEEFAEALRRVEESLADEIKRLEVSREQVSRLTSADSPALPPEVNAYLRRLREIGVAEAIVAGERDGWILLSARWPELAVEWMPGKIAQLEDPRVVRLYQLLGRFAAGEDVLEEVADTMATLNEEAAVHDLGIQDDLAFDLLDALAEEADPRLERLLHMMRDRGWNGIARVERLEGVSPVRAPAPDRSGPGSRRC